MIVLQLARAGKGQREEERERENLIEKRWDASGFVTQRCVETASGNSLHSRLQGFGGESENHCCFGGGRWFRIEQLFWRWFRIGPFDGRDFHYELVG